MTKRSSDIAGSRHPLVANSIVRAGRTPQPDRWVIKDVSDVLGDGSWRIYRATPCTTEVRADGFENGKAVVGREQADFRLQR